MRDHVRFRSTSFAPASEEAAETNPGRYGFELASWLLLQLRSRGVLVEEPFAEDWGWLVQALYMEQALAIACGNVDGTRDEWLIWVEGHRPGFLRRMFGGRQPSPDEDGRGALIQIIDDVLREEPNVSSIEWFRTARDMSETDHGPRP